MDLWVPIIIFLIFGNNIIKDGMTEKMARLLNIESEGYEDLLLKSNIL